VPNYFFCSICVFGVFLTTTIIIIIIIIIGVLFQKKYFCYFLKFFLGNGRTDFWGPFWPFFMILYLCVKLCKLILWRVKQCKCKIKLK
jgi:hypothetical protein